MPSLRAQISALCKGNFRTKQYNPDNSRVAYVVWDKNMMVALVAWPIGDKVAEKAALEKVLDLVNRHANRKKTAQRVYDYLISQESHVVTQTLTVFNLLTEGRSQKTIDALYSVLGGEVFSYLSGRDESVSADSQTSAELPKK